MSKRDNIPGISNHGIFIIFLWPGLILQWFMYMYPSKKGLHGLASSTRLARSPLMTYVYSAILWGAAISFYLGGFKK